MRRAAAATAGVLSLLLAGCSFWRPATVPLRVIAADARCASRPDTLLVLLPGSYSLPEDFEREGFVDALRERQIAVDLRLVDAHMTYYRERSIIDRLQADVIAPARTQGYRHIWIAGISLGGLGAMLYTQARPEDIDGVVALAPYLGTREFAAQIAKAGGLRAWTPAASSPPADDLDGHLWRWLKQRAGADPAEAPLVLGYGLADRFVFNDDVLAAALPPSRVFTTDGGHDWPAWKRLWRQLLPTLALPRDPTCRAT